MDLTERLARMWIECDPNRGGPGRDPDDIMQFDNPESTLNGEPNWKWFVPRAEATLAYLEKHGLKIVGNNDG